MKQLHVDFITKDCKNQNKGGQLKLEQVSQIGTCIRK